jgi:DNA-binding NarL/FixJ family response regulator
MLITVSIVEDNASFRTALMQLIQATDELQLLHAYSSAEQGLAILNHPPDVAIVDIQLPGMSGIELIKRIRQQNPAVQCLVCSAHDDDEHVFAALENGASGYLLKESTSAQIVAAIKEIHHGGSPMSPYIARRVIASFQKRPATDAALLSEREKEVLQLLSKGLLYKEIAERLFISHETVKKHLRNIYGKLHVQNKVEALNKFRLL